LASLLAVAPLAAQKGRGGVPGIGSSPGHAPGFGGHPNAPIPNGINSRRFPRLYGFHGGRYYSPYYPYWGDSLYWGDDFYWDDEMYARFAEEPYSGPAVNLTSSPAAMMASRGPCTAVPQNAVNESPKLIEIPQAKDAPSSNPPPPTLFVLANGERLEAHHYMLTANSLFVSVGRQERTIPLSSIDLNATIASNLKRGIDLKVPSDQNRIFLGF